MASIRPLSSALSNVARDELNENPEEIQRNIEILREWISKQPHLKSRTTDQFLLAFLRGCKHSIEKAKLKIDKFYTVRGSIPEICANRTVDDPKCRDIIKMGIALRLLKTDGECGPRVTIIRAGGYDANQYSMIDCIKVGMMMADISFIEDDNATVCGQIEILDLANVTLKHGLQVDLVLMKKLAIFSEQAAPMRQRAMHLINTPVGIEPLLNAFKGFLSEKRRKRIFIHSDMESLYKHINKDILPLEYGGCGQTIKEITDYWEKKIFSYKDYIAEENSFVANEKFRIGTPNYVESLYGIGGTFKSLNVD